MPELPEVEFGRKLAERLLAGERLAFVRCAADDIVYEGVGPSEVQAALDGARVHAVHRKGKHLWLELDRRPWPCFHFGMSGAFRARDVAPLVLESSPKTPDPAWPPRFAKIELRTSSGAELYMVDPRRLGRIRLRMDPAAEPPISLLGFDPLLEMPSLTEFCAGLATSRKVVKGLLLDQSFAAGVGNWIADEVLYQADLDPRRRADALTTKESARLHASLAHVIDAAVAVDADKERLPPEWLFHRRWGKTAGATDADGRPIEFIQVAGRTTAWVPSKQR